MKEKNATSVHRPIIILGAARSGTKLLRSIINASAHVSAVPYDVNYIWRFGNENFDHDALPKEAATKDICMFIRAQLLKSSSANEMTRIVEKTVSNALRIPFVNAVLPDAQYIFIVRDGRDVVESALRCWQQRPEIGYMLQKLRTYPWQHCMSYAIRVGLGLVTQRLGMGVSNHSWGPRYPGINHDLGVLDLATICAKQWQVTMSQYESDKGVIPAASLLEIRYEDLVSQPEYTALQIGQYLQLSDVKKIVDFAKEKTTKNFIGRSKQMEQSAYRKAISIIEPTLDRWGYLNTADLKKVSESY